MNKLNDLAARFPELYTNAPTGDARPLLLMVIGLLFIMIALCVWWVKL